jgi:hypothetical protein
MQNCSTSLLFLPTLSSVTPPIREGKQVEKEKQEGVGKDISRAISSHSF